MPRIIRLFVKLAAVVLILLGTASFAADSDKGYLQVNVANPGIRARVFVNGQSVGTATRLQPVNTMQGIPVGPAHVRVEAEGFQAHNRQEIIRSNQWTQAVIELKPAVAAPPPPPPPAFSGTPEPAASQPARVTTSYTPPNDPTARCQSLMDAGHLSEPASANATDCYFDVLESDPANSEALEALDLIETRLLARIQTAIRHGDGPAARSNWRHLEQLSPGHPQLHELDQQIQDMAGGHGERDDTAAITHARDPQDGGMEYRAEPPPLFLPPSSGPVRAPPMARIPAGCFSMGSPSWEGGRDLDEAQAQICLEGFDMALYEVSVEDFHRFVQASAYQTDAEWNRERAQGCFSEGADGGWTYVPGRTWRQPGFLQQARHPVVCVSWQDALAYIDWISAETGQQFRLPTEAEWEYAARAGNANSRYWGDAAELACQYANVADKLAADQYKGFEAHGCEDGYAQTAPVGSYRPNGYGLYDMIGNVAEWTCSYYENSYQGGEKRCSRRDSSALRVNRGGSWTTKPDWARSATRVRLWSRGRADSLGFRLVRDVASTTPN